MNSGLFKKLLPHLIAIVIFLVVSVFFCKPVLEGNVLNQSFIRSILIKYLPCFGETTNSIIIMDDKFFVFTLLFHNKRFIKATAL